MALTLVCPACSSSMVVASIHPGVQVRCPGCKHVFMPPSPWLSPAPVPAPQFLPPPPPPVRQAPPPAEILSLDDEPVRGSSLRGTPHLRSASKRQDQEEPPARSNTPALIGGAVALLLVVGGVGFWLATRDGKRDETDSTSATNTASANTPKKEKTTGALPADESKDAAILDTLIQVVRTGEPGDRLAAARRLGALGAGGASAVPALLTVADPKSPALESAIGTALAKIGAPKAGGEAALVNALGSKSAVAREYAAETLAKSASIPEEAVATLVGVLGDTSATVRAGAAKALGVAGPKAKAVVLAPLLEVAADPDDAVRTAVTAGLAKLGPFEADDRAVLEKKLAHTDARVRVAAAGLLAQLVTTAEDATKTWPPLLKDRDPDVRAFVLGQMVKHPEALEQCGEAVVMLLADPTPAARLTAVNLATKVKGTAGLEAGLEKLAFSETDVEIKSAAMVAAVTIADATEERLVLFRKVLTTGSAPAKRAAADRIALLKDKASPVVDELIACVANADEEVRAAAIRALSAVGKDGDRGRGAVEKAFAADKSEPVVVAAANYLAESDPGRKVLKSARDRELPPTALAAICRAFAAAPDKDSLKWLTAQAAGVEACREVVTAALAKHGTDEHVVELIELTYKTRVPKPGQPPLPVAIETRRWALATLTKMDCANICTAATKVRLADRVKDLSMSIGANEKELAAEAATFLKTLKP